MAGITSLKKCQWGLETTAGTPVAATIVWRGVVDGKDGRKLVTPAEEIGMAIPSGRMYEQLKHAIISLKEGPATFEQLPYPLSAGLADVVAGVKDGVGSGYAYAYPLWVSTVSAVKAYTIEYGDNQQAFEAEYCTLSKFTIKSVAGEALTFSGEMFGRQETAHTFTATLALPTVEEILASKGKLYIDDSGDTIGTTQMAASLRDIEIQCATGREPHYTHDGMPYFTDVDALPGTIKGKMVLRNNTAAQAEVTAAKAGTIRLLQVVWEGSALATPGTAYTYKTLLFKSAIQYDDPGEYADARGARTVTLNWHSIYSDSIQPTFIVVNEVASL